MLLSNFSINRPISMVVVIIALMAMGFMALNKLREIGLNLSHCLGF